MRDTGGHGRYKGTEEGQGDNRGRGGTKGRGGQQEVAEGGRGVAGGNRRWQRANRR